MNKKTAYILVAIVVVLAIAIWSGTRVKAPTTETPAGETPAEETPAGETPTAATPAGEAPAAEAPKTEESPLGEFVPTAPVQTLPLVVEELPETVIKLEVSANGFSPNEFTAKPGQTVSLAVTSMDMTHVFKFEDPSLDNVAIGIGNKETRGISFKAPQKKGDYAFYCDVPGHRGRGEAGVMHVK